MKDLESVHNIEPTTQWTLSHYSTTRNAAIADKRDAFRYINLQKIQSPWNRG